MLKRESEVVSTEGMPLSALSNGQQLIFLVGSDPAGKLLGRRKETYDNFCSELVTFISRHFSDDRIANPDLKETYLVRLNVLL